MILIAFKLYDPAVAVTKSTAALLAMTAVDTANLRLSVPVPNHGKVRFRLACALHGAATMAQIFLGVMQAAAILGRVAPTLTASNLAITTLYQAEAEFTVDLSAQAGTTISIDAAYGVETLVAATGIKFGGPNNATANDAFGAFVFEAWDAQPQTLTNTGLVLDNNGRVGIYNVLGIGQTGGDICARLPAALVGGRMDSSVGAMAANVITAAAAAADFGAELADAVWDEAIAGHLTAGTTGAVLNGAGAAGDPWSTALPGAYAAGTAGNIIGNRLDVAVSTRGTGVALDAAGVRGAVGLAAANLDAQLDGLPTAAEIRIEMDANSVDLNTLVGGVAAIFARTDVATSSRAAPGDAMGLTPGALVALADSVWDEVVDSGKTGRELHRLYASALLAKLSGMNTGAPVFRDLADTKNRITGATDASGNRTAVAFDAS